MSSKINFNDDSKVIYIPELSDQAYTGKDFLNLCNGSEEKAQILFDLCDWQHPETILDELRREEENFSTSGTEYYAFL